MKPVSGLLHSDVPGRTDRLPIVVSPDSYVLPADYVSGYGQGNTTGGAALLNQIFEPHMRRGLMMMHGRKRGGMVLPNGDVPIVAAGGEYVVHPAVIYSMGNGDPRLGHRAMDNSVRRRRQALAKHLASLPGPRND